ncbi:MAG: recombinase family protein [Clostridium sp.]|nr:recombinase family protein [Clostridium sp.]
MERLIQKVEFEKVDCPKLLKVAAYARVSSGKDAMLHSLSAQVSYYNRLIQSNPEWLFCGVYADEAMTGTKDNRENFQKMLSECRAGNLDLIITKSISRFARNTVTLLETVRELKGLGVGVYFEEQSINSLSADGELMLTILASYAQEESYTASENQKWRIRRDFELGKVSSIRMLGYRRTPDGSLEIIEPEAETVRMIFHDYLDGMGKQAIANKLNNMHIPTLNGCEWKAGDIRRILQNEKYSGDMLLQKTFSENHLTKRKIINNGNLPQYFVKNSHEAIIEKSVFNAVQKRFKEQNKRFSVSKPTTTAYPFTGKIQCGNCGKNYRRKTTVTGIVWICATYNTKGKKYCPTAKQIPENTLFSVCCDVLTLKEFDGEIFGSRIDKILVPAPNELIFIFHDGHEVSANWQDRSRSESWTDEMKKKARERSRKWRER